MKCMSVFSSLLFPCLISSIVKNKSYFTWVLNMRWQSELNVVRPKGCVLKNKINKSQLSIVSKCKPCGQGSLIHKKITLVHLLFNESLIQWTPISYFSDVSLIINICISVIVSWLLHFQQYISRSMSVCLWWLRALQLVPDILGQITLPVFSVPTVHKGILNPHRLNIS